MTLFEFISKRWKQEERERVEKARLFDVKQNEETLVLMKRRAPVSARAVPAGIAAVLWPLGNWYIYQSSANRDIWVGWVILWCLFGPIIASPTLYEAWRVHKGEVWTVDSNRESIEHNGIFVATFDQIKSVRVWVQSDSDANPISHLALVDKNGERFGVSNRGNARENWDELNELAQRIARILQVPVEI